MLLMGGACVANEGCVVADEVGCVNAARVYNVTML